MKKKKILSKSIATRYWRKGLLWSVLTAACIAGVGYSANVLFWDADGNAVGNDLANQSGLGGSGTWDTTTAKWWDGGAADTTWNNAALDSAVFGGQTSGTVTTGAPVVVSRLTFNTGSYTVALSAANTLTLQTANGDPAPVVVANANATIGTAGVAGLISTQGMTKAGGGTLTVVGDNTGYVGITTLQSGTLALSGGTDTTTTSVTSLGNAQPIVLQGGTLRYLNNSGIAQYNNDIIVQGNATINVDRATAGSSGIIELGSLTLGSNTLTTTSGNGYGLRFMGTTTLNSAISTINATFNPSAGVFNAAGATTLAGMVTGPGALNKIGGGTLFVYNLFGGADNNYTGGTNVLQGTLALGDTFAQLGSGQVIVSPGAALRIEDNLNFFSIEDSGAGLLLQSSSTAMSALGLDGDFTPNTPALQNAKISPYGVAIQINSPTTTFIGDFNFANFGTGAAGTGKVFLGAIVNTTLNGFDGQLTAGADNEYRLGANASSGVTLTLSLPNLINGGDNASLVIGQPIQNIVSMTNGTGTVLIADSQNYGGLTTVNSGSTLTASVAATPDATPLGTGATNPVIDVYGTLNLTGGDYAQLAQSTLNVSQARGANGVLNLNVTSNEFAGIGTVDERLKDTVVLNFNGGTLTFAGYNSGNVTGSPLISSQTIGAFNISAANSVVVTSAATSTTDQDAILTFTNLNRVNNGSVTFAHTGTTQPALGQPSVGTSSDIRVFITNLNGAAPVVTNGMLAPYLLDVSNTPLTSGATTSSSTTVTVASTVGLAPGMIVTGANIPTGASIVAIIDGTSFEISRAATGSATGQSFTANGQQFVTYGPDGVAPAAFDVQATSASALQSATASQIVSVDAGFNTTANATVHALRIGDNTLGGSNTITIGAQSLAEDGAGLILNQATARTHTPNFTFGTGGNREAVIYVTGGQTATLSGLISADGLTKSGANTLVLTGNNVNLNGTLTVNQGTLQGTVGAFNFRPVVLNAGTLNYDNSGNARYLNDITVNGDSAITAGDVEMPLIASVTINPRAGGNPDPIVFNIGQGLSIAGDVVLNGDVAWNQTRADRNNDLRARVLIAGKVTGVGSFNKWSGSTSQTGVTAFLNGANDYQGVTTVNGGTLESLTAVGTPFSTGAITVNPGSILRIASPSNISGNDLTINSDRVGLAVLSLAYSGNVGVNGGLTGTIHFNNANIGGPFSAVFAIDATGYSGDIDLSTLGGGTAYLGTAIGGNFSGHLTPAAANSLIPDLNGGAPVTFAGGVYRLGGGGTGFLNMTGAANQLTGNNVVQIGATSNVTQGASNSLINGGQNNNTSTGNIGAVQIVNVNNYTGPTILNGGAVGGVQLASAGALSVGNNFAIGTGQIIFNGGSIQAATNTGRPFLAPVITISNPIGFTGDAGFYGSSDLILAGPVSLADNQVGVTRNLTVSNNAAFAGVTAVTIIAGDISDGAGAASLNGITKLGAGVLEFRGNNTYSGFTNINGGTILVSSDSSISPNSQITFNGGALGVWNTSMSTSRDYNLIGSGTFDIGDGKTLTQVGPSGMDLGSIISGPGTLIKTGLGTLILNGTNANNGGNAVQINNGILQISANVNLGDPVANGQIVAAGGTLRVDGTFSSARNILPNTNATTSLGLNITEGNTFTSTGVLNNNGTGIFTLLKTGAGTFINNNASNSLKRLYITNGVFQTSSNTPIAAAGSEMDLSGGTLFLKNLAGNQSVVTPLVNFLGGGHIDLQSAGGFSGQFAPTSLDRLATGTLVISGGTSTLGGAGNTNAVRVLPTNMNFAIDRTAVTTASNVVTVANTADLAVGMTVTGQGIPANATITAINSPTSITISAAASAANTFLTFGGNAPRANALNNGIFSASILTADSSGVASFSTNDPTTGIVAFNGYTSLGANPATFDTPTLIGDVGVGGTTLTGVNSLYAIRTSGNISGGTLKIGSISSSRAGGIIVNANSQISSNLIIDPTSSDARLGSAASGEGLFYVAPNVTATITGNILANSFTKFGAGTIVIGGDNNGILGALTVQEGTLEVAPGAQFARLATDLVLNGQGTLDLNGSDARFSSLYNTAGVGGGIIINNGSSDATVTIFAPTATVAVPPPRAGLIGQNNKVITGLASTADLQVGMSVSGTNIAGGAYIQSIDSPTQITIAAAGNNANTGASTQTVTFGSSIFAGRIMDGATNELTFVKNGAGTVILGGFSTAAPRAGDNTYTGGTVLNQGTLQIQNPLALGGADGTTPGWVTLFGGTLDLRDDGGGINGTIILGNPNTNGVDMLIAGPATIRVDRFSSANTGNVWQINNLTLSENTLTMAGANNYGFRVAGTTTIAGSYASINSTSDQANGNIELAGLITGVGALDHYGTAIQRVTTISGSANDYSGGTNIVSGSLQVTATSGTPLGTGRVNVFPGAELRIAGLDPTWQSGAFSSVAGQAQLHVHGYYNNLGVVSLDGSFDPSSLLTAANFSNAYGSLGVGLSNPYFTQTLDMSTIGDGRAFLISGITTEVAYVASNLIPGVGNGVSPRTYRLAGGVNNLAFIGEDNVLNDLAAAGTSLQVGSPNSIFGSGGAIGVTGNAVILRNSNNYTGGTWIGKGSAINLGVGGSPAGSTPLGSSDGTLTGAPSDVIIYGTLQLESRLESSYFNAATGKNANNYILMPGGNINITDFAGDEAGGNGRWADADANGGGLNLNGGSFRYNGAAHLDSSEIVGTFAINKNSRILLDRSNNSGTVTLTVNDLVRGDRGTLLIQALQGGTTTANILGIPAQSTAQLQQAAGYDHLIVSNAGSLATTLGGTTSMGTGAVNGGMAPGWIIDASANSFVTYNPTGANTGYQTLVTSGSPGASGVAANGTFTPGVNQVGYSKVITSSGTISGSISLTANDIVDINASGGVTLNSPSTSVYALRTNRDVNPTAANDTFTITSGALISTSNTLSFNSAPAPANGAPLDMTLNFGVGGTAEALIYTASSMTINAQINAAGLTHFAGANSGSSLTLTGNNNFTDAIWNNQGILQGTNTLSGVGVPVSGVFNNQDIYLSGANNRDASRLILRSGVGNEVSAVQASNVEATSQFGGTIFVNGDSRLDTNGGVFQRINNLTFADLGPLSPVGLALGNIYVAGTTTLGAHDNYIEGFFNTYSSSVFAGLVQGGTLTKWGNGTMLMAGTANTYAATVINQGGTNTASSIFGSLTRTGTPFGAGTITINPGAMLRLADASNIAQNAVTLKSDGVALGGLAIAYNSTANIADLFGTGAGKVNLSTTGDYLGVIALDINNYINPIDMGALELAAGGKLWLGTSISSTYFGRTLTPGADNVYRLGGGGNQGNLTIGAGSFENVLTGTASVVIGAQTAGINPNGPAYINGNFGSVILTNRNDFSGGLTLNNQAGLAVNNSYALGSGIVFHNGGNLTLNNSVSIPNEMDMVGDIFSTSGGSNAAILGEVKLAPEGVGGIVTFNVNGGGHLGFQGVISGASAEGISGSNVVKAGGQTIIFNGMNTYRGTTSVTSGFLGIGTDVYADTAGALGINDVPVILSGTGGFLLGGQITMDRSIMTAGTTNEIRGQVLATSVISGGIAVTSGTLIIDQTSSSNTTFRGGVIDIQGPISGSGAVQIGTANVQGSVRLSAQSNGYGTNTFTGGLVLSAGRLQINSDTYYTGPADNPTILSGPLGTGTLTFGSGNGNAGGEIVAYGADRTILNALGAMSTAGDTTTTFGGHYDLTFTRDLNINSDSSLRNRVFNVLASQGRTTFLGDLTSSGAAGGRITKNGAGTLVLAGNNTFFGAAGTSLITLSGGVIRFTQDANLGRISTTQSNFTISGAGTLALEGTTPVTWDASTSNRNLNLTSSSGAIAVSDPNGLFTLNTRVTGAFGLLKQGPGTLALNANNNQITTLTIGGAPVAAAANLLSGTAGGTVSTTATSGTPFATSTVTLYDGTLSLIGGASAQALTIPTINFGGGSNIQFDHGSSTSQLTGNSIVRLNQGTLTILPSTISALGNTERLIAGNAGSAFPVANGMLVTPTVFVRLPGAGQDANFTTYGVNGFQLHTATTQGAFTTSDATIMVDVTGGAQAVPDSAFDVLALRTDSNITAAGANSQINIATGGLILNGNTAPIINPNIYFGDGTTSREAIVFVRDGQTGAATLAGNFTAGNFTKSGLGALYISGTNNVMNSAATTLPTFQINDGVVQFAGQSSLPNQGAVGISPMDTGTFDLAGHSLVIGALGGNSAASAATGIVTNSGAAASLEVFTRNGITSNFNGLIQGDINLVASGRGTLILGENNTYTGGTRIDAGPIASANGLYIAPGALQINSFNSLGSGPVIFDGGTLDIRNSIAPNEVEDNIDVITLGPGAGYDFVISALNNFGATNTTSTINVNSTAGFQAINSLTINAPVLSTGGGTDNGVLVRGTTTLAGDTILNIGRPLVLGGKIDGSGGIVTKIGGSTLYITNADRGADANAVAGWSILQGTMEVRLSQGGSNPLGDGTTIQLSGGNLNLRHDGDNLSDPQVLDTFRTNDLLIGSLIPVTSEGFTSSANSTLDTRTISNGNIKTLLMGQLRFGGPLGTAFLSYNSGNTYSVEFTGGLSMIHDAALSLNQQNVTIDGNITGNGTLFKQGGAELDINTNATGNDPIGGTVLASGSTYFASWEGNTRTLSTTAKLQGGNITIQPNASLRFTAITNLNGNQRVDVRSNLSSLGLIGIGDNTEISNYNLRTVGAAGVFDPSALTGSAGGGILALNNLYTHNIDLGRLGDGTWFLGSTSDGSGANVFASLDGRYDGGAMGAGARFVGIGNDLPTYRLGGGGGNLYIGLAQPGSEGNQLHGNANLVVGSALTNGGFGSFGTTATNTTGSAGVILNQDQSYTGLTLVNHGSQLEFRGAMATTGYNVFGILVAGGTNGSFVGGPTPILYPGGEINLDSQFDLLPVGNVEGRWGDATAVNLNSDIFRVIGNSAADLREVVGQVSASGGSYLIPQRTFGGRIMEVNIAGLTRIGTGTLSIEPGNGGQMGSDERVTVVGADLTSQLANIPGGIVNGMVAPWMFNGRDVQFLTYSDFGFVNAGFSRVANGSLSASSSTVTDRTFINGSSTMAPNAVLSAYALRSDGNITLTSASDTTAKIIIGSGGLLTNGAISITPALVFGSIATPGEAIIVNNNNLVIGTTSNATTSGQITATNIVKAGDGNMFMDAEQGTFSGPIALNRGGLYIRSASTTALPSSNAGGQGSVISINGYGLTVGFRSDATNGGTFFNNSVVIGQDNLLAIINFDRAVGTSVSDKIVGINGGITWSGAPGEQGQTLTLSIGNNMQFEVKGGLDFGPVGNAILNVPDLNVNGVRRSVITVDGALTGDGTFVKAGGGQMFATNLSSLNDYSGGTMILQGNLIIRAAANPVANGEVTDITLGGLGTGPITLQGGALLVQADADNATNTRERINFANDIHVLGNTQIDVNRNGVISPAGTGNDIRFASLSIGNQTLTTTGGNSYALEIAGATTIRGNPTFNVSSADLVLRGVVDDGGGDNFIVKNGGATLWFDSANSFTGGIFINSGTLRFGNIVSGNNTATAGSGLITLNPGGQIQLQAATNLVPGQQVAVHSIPNALATFLTYAVYNPTGVITSDSTGLLRIPTNYNIALDLAAIGDGTFQLGTTGNNSYTAPTLGVGAGNLYRLAGGGQAINFNSFDNVITGDARVQVGSINSSGTLVLSRTNDYTGGTTVVRGSTLQWNPTATDQSPLGTGQVDVFGQTIAYGTGGNYMLNTFVFHPGATFRIDNNAGGNVNTDRWDDNAAVALNGATLSFNGRSGVVSTETYGDLTFAAGSRIALSSQGTGQVELTIPSFQRVGGGTMVFTTGGGNRLGAAAGNNSERVLVTGTAPTPSPAGMLPGYVVNGTDNTFVTYDAVTGFKNAAFTQTYGSTFGTGLTAGTDIVNVTATSTLNDDPVIHALRLVNASLNNGTGQFNTITFAESGGDMGGIIVSGGNSTISPNLTFGLAGDKEALFYIEGGRTATVTSDITAGSITKFGTGALQINKDQSDAARGPGQGYSGGWVVNEGQLTVTAFGGLGNAVASNTVTLTRSTSSVPVLRLQINNASNSQTNTGNVLNQTFTSGKIIAIDEATISFDPGADDKTNSIADLEVQSTGGNLLDARLRFDIARLRALLQAGHLTLSGNAIIDVNAAYLGGVTSGSSVGLSVADISGPGRLTKWGNGVLYVRGDSLGYSAPVNIEQGAISVHSNGALGTGAITVNRMGVLDIAVANYVPTNSSLTYMAGSIERWSVDGARVGAINLGGATLQIGNDQTSAAPGTTVVTLNGGSIEGYLRTDDNIWRSNNNQGAVYRTVNTGTSFVLAGNSFLGQNITEGANGIDNGVQPNIYTPYTNAASGVILEIKGDISGIGGLTKQGYDTVTLSGHNTYSGGTTVTQGMLRIGANDSLLTTGALATNYDGVFDLNGFNQTVGQLSAPAKAVDNASGFITNTATTINTLTIGNDFNGDTTYGGVIQYNIALTKNGLGELMLTGANTFFGPTIINSGSLRLTHATGSVLDGLLNTSSLTLANGTSLHLRTGTGAGLMTLAGTSGTVLTLGGNNTLSVEVGGGGGTGIALKSGAKALVTGTVTVNVYGTSTGATDPSIVISAPSGGLLTTNGSSGNFLLGKVYNNTDFIVTGLTQTDTLVQLNTQAQAALTAAYWLGGLSNEWAVSGAGISNWASDVTGTVSGLVPGPTTDVFLSAQGRVNQDNMVLAANMTIQSLTINNTSGDPVVLKGDDGKTLTITAANAITTDAGAGSSALQSKLSLTAPEAIITVNSSNPLEIDGPISGTAITKAGTGTLVLAGANTYTGPTLITGGTLKIGADNTLPVLADLNFGSSDRTAPGTTAGTLDLSDHSTTVLNLNVFTNSTTAVNQIVIGAGQVLQVDGTFTVGPNLATANTTTKLTVTGAGTLQVGTPTEPTFANFVVGGSTTSNFGNSATLDMSGLANFYANLGSGTLSVGDVSDSAGGGTGNSTLSLAVNNTILASIFRTDGAHFNTSANFQKVILGSGTNVINANTLNFGITAERGHGSVGFDAADTTGTVKIRALDTVSRAIMNVAYGNSQTGAGPTETVDFTGHQADLLLSTLNIAGRTATGGGSSTGIFRFDQGVLDVLSITLGDRRITGSTGAVTGTLDLLGGNVTIGDGGITIATNTSTAASNTATGTLNIGGTANVTVGETGGTSIILGRSTTAGIVANATMNVTGSSHLTVAGDIVEATGAGNGSIVSTVTLNGGTLDMGGHNLGTATEAINNLNFQSGTLRDVGTINGTGGLTKTTSGTLYLEGTNAYTGTTNINAGTLLVRGSINGSAVAVNDTGILGGAQGLGAATTGAVTVNTGGILAPGEAPGTTGILTTLGDLTFMDGATFQLEINGTTAGSGYDQQIVTGNTLISSTGTILTLGGSYDLGATGDIFTVILNSGGMSTTSGFSNAPNGSTIIAANGQAFQISYFDDASTAGFELSGGNDVSLRALAIPEPSVLTTLAGSIGLALGLQRFRRHGDRKRKAV